MPVGDRFDYYGWVRFMRQPDIRSRIAHKKSQKKRRLAKRRAGKKK